jgi:hypothetical protein
MNKNSNCVHNIKEDACKQTTFIILCAKKSQNRGRGNVSLQNVDKDNTLIDLQIKTITKNYVNNEIILVSGFEHDRLINHIISKEYKNIRILENRTYKSSDILDGWRLSLNIALENDTYIIHGDRYFDKSCITGYKNTHVITHKKDRSNYDLGILQEDNKLINISYGLPSVWSEIIFLSHKDIGVAKKIINEHKKRKIYTLESFINQLSREVKICVVDKEPQSITLLKEL